MPTSSSGAAPHIRRIAILLIKGLLIAAVLAAAYLLSAGSNWPSRLPEKLKHPLAAIWPEPDWRQIPTGAALNEVKQRGTLVVAVREYPRPAPPSAPTPPEPDDFDASMARFIATRLGVDLKLVGLKQGANGSYLAPAEPVDLIIAGAAQTHADGADAQAIHTHYNEAPVQLMVLRGSSIQNAQDLRGRSVCLQRGSSHADAVSSELGAVPRSYPSGVHAVYAFMSGECDALAEDAELIQRLTRHEEWRFYRPVRAAALQWSGASSPDIKLTRTDKASANYLDAIARYWQLGGGQILAREQRVGNVSFELEQLQNGLICHS